MEDLDRLRASYAADPGAYGIALAWELAKWPRGGPALRERAAEFQAEAIRALRAAAASGPAVSATARQDLVYFLSNYAHMLCTLPAAAPEAFATALGAATEAVALQRAILSRLLRSGLPVRDENVQDAHDTLVLALIAVATAAIVCGQTSDARATLDEASDSALKGREPWLDETLAVIGEIRKRANPLRLVPQPPPPQVSFEMRD